MLRVLSITASGVASRLRAKATGVLSATWWKPSLNSTPWWGPTACCSGAQFRQNMIEENLLDAVIGLPGNLFPTTDIPVVILVFDRSREKGGVREECKNIFFVEAS